MLSFLTYKILKRELIDKKSQAMFLIVMTIVSGRNKGLILEFML